MLDLVKEDRDHWVHVASIVLPLRPQNFDEWFVSMENMTMACDEFFLFILSRMHYQHTVVYMMKRSWTTLCVYGSMSEEEIHAACDLHLIYLGQDVYGQMVLTIMPSTHIQTPSITPVPTVPTAPNASHTRHEKQDWLTLLSANSASTSVVPPLQAVILPLKLLVVEYLRTCNSVLVNPIVFTNVPAAASPQSKLTKSSSPNSPASNDDGKSVNSEDGNDVKSANSEEKLLNYDDFLIKSVDERKYGGIMKELSLDIINQWTGRVPHWSRIDPYSSLEDE